MGLLPAADPDVRQDRARIEGERFEHALDELKARKGVGGDLDLDAADLEELVGAFKEIVVEETGPEFPQDPREQLDPAIDAVFTSWNTDRARLYRRQERIPNELGTAVNVVSDGVRQHRRGLGHRRLLHP